MNLLATFATYERDKLRERTRDLVEHFGIVQARARSERRGGLSASQ